MTTIKPSQSTASYDSIKLGIDAHAQYYWVSRQVDGATPQPVQNMTYEEPKTVPSGDSRLERAPCAALAATELTFVRDWNPRQGRNLSGP
jgi:hypothetical protein